MSASVVMSDDAPVEEKKQVEAVKENAEKDHLGNEDGKNHAKEHGEHHTEFGVGPDASKDPTEFRSDLAIYTLVVFGLLFLGLMYFAWGPIVSAIDARETSVRNDIAAAEDGRLKAEKMLAEHAAKLEAVQDEVKEIIAEARRDADQTKQDIVAAAQAEAVATRDRAVSEIERARDQALEAVFDKMSETVAMATEHVVGHGFQADDQDRLIDEALAQFASNNL